MTVHFVTDKKIAETSSNGNQEKWFDSESNKWYKLDQFGYEALSETFISMLLKDSNIETETQFKFVRYHMEKLNVHNRNRTGCSSDSFLQKGQSLITVSHLLSKNINGSLISKFEGLSSDKKRIAFLADSVAAYTGLKDFPQYLTLLFEIDSLFLNDDRHLNNIAVLEQDGIFDYCPIFDNGAGLLSDTMTSAMDIDASALISQVKARPFNTTFTRQMNSARSLHGSQLRIKRFSKSEIEQKLRPLLEYYPNRDREIITDRVSACILLRQKFN